LEEVKMREYRVITWEDDTVWISDSISTLPMESGVPREGWIKVLEVMRDNVLSEICKKLIEDWIDEAKA
jgi:hypothetical protein